mmetsp:Transcript_8595/g.17183  ORF Transcript_8595/g.17183 Transcript_8595/m.17183 type:complete len:105 (-) Transcript_8595:201-515(-)
MVFLKSEHALHANAVKEPSPFALAQMQQNGGSPLQFHFLLLQVSRLSWLRAAGPECDTTGIMQLGQTFDFKHCRHESAEFRPALICLETSGEPPLLSLVSVAIV